MKTLNTLPKIGAILFFIISIISCQEDFNTIGVGIVGDDSLNPQLDDSNTVVAYSRKLAPVQTNIIPISQLGVFNDGTFGKSTVNYLTQLLLDSPDPVFGDELGEEIVLDSVMLYLPYFNNSTDDDEGETTYTLDSVYGSDPINISMYESNYFLRELDPNSNFQDPQYYYSNQGPLFEDNLLQNDLFIDIENFVPSSDAHILISNQIGEDGEEVIDTSTIVPGIRVPLSNSYFQEKILDKEGDAVLSNNNNFKDYFRGLYFKVNSNTDTGNLFIFNPELANITLYYNYLSPELDGEGNQEYDEDGNPIINTIYKEFVISFAGINLNVFDNELSPEVASAIESPNVTEGEENLYIRGGDGIVTVIDLFGEDLDEDGVADELEVLRDKDWIINNANLKFYIDQSKITGGETEPERITIYNINNNTVLADYFLDPTSGDEPINAITNHMGRIERGSDDKGVSYNINITHHVSTLIKNDSTNVSLGLITSQNVLLNGFQKLDTLQSPNQDLQTIKTIQRNSVISHEGTVLFGNRYPNDDKRLKLEIYYTEPF